MADHSDHCLLRKIDEARSSIDHSQRQINILERNLRLSTVVDDEKDEMLLELKKLRKEFQKQEKYLEGLQKKNQKTFLLVLIISIIGLLLYLILKNPENATN